MTRSREENPKGMEGDCVSLQAVATGDGMVTLVIVAQEDSPSTQQYSIQLALDADLARRAAASLLQAADQADGTRGRTPVQ